jgi:hypothetical protein
MRRGTREGKVLKKEEQGAKKRRAGIEIQPRFKIQYPMKNQMINAEG